MKRCPVEAGGCGQLVEMLFDSGLCQSCDAQVQAGTAAAGGPPVKKRRNAGRKPRETASAVMPVPGRCKRYLKDPTQRGICVCGATRAEHLKKPKRAVVAREKSSAGTGGIGALREKYQKDLLEAKNRVAIVKMALTVLDDVEAALAGQ